MEAHAKIAFLDAAAALHGLALEPEQLRRVAEVFARNVDVAQLVMTFPLPDVLDLAPGSPAVDP